VEGAWTERGGSVDNLAGPSPCPVGEGLAARHSIAPAARVYKEWMRTRALLSAFLLLASCAEVQKLARSAVKDPKLTFRSASIERLDMEGATVAFTWDLENPNGFGLDLARVGWTVDVEGTRIASGDLPGGLQIKANGTSPVTFPVRVRFQDVPGIVSLLGSGKDAIRYRLGGTLGVRTPVGVLDLPLSHEDRLRLPSMPRFALDGVAVRSMSFREVALDVRVRVRNPNAFALPVGRLDYALAIGGAPVARAEAAELAGVAGGSSAVVAIPVRLDLASAGRAAAALSGGGEVQVDLDGKATVAGIPLPLDLSGRVPARR
jgi:LEA14-like dessication related protein